MSVEEVWKKEKEEYKERYKSIYRNYINSQQGCSEIRENMSGRLSEAKHILNMFFGLVAEDISQLEHDVENE